MVKHIFNMEVSSISSFHQFIYVSVLLIFLEIALGDSAKMAYILSQRGISTLMLAFAIFNKHHNIDYVT